MKKQNLDIGTVRALHQTRQFDQARAGYLALLRKNPRDVDVLHGLGILCAQTENFADATRYLETALKYQPDSSILQLHLANALKTQGLFDRAVDILQKTITDHPNYALALNNLGTVFHLQGKFAEAIAVYHRAIQLEPEFIDAYYNLGLALTRQNQTDEAILTFQKILELTPEHFAARFHLASVWMKKEKTDNALTEFLLIEKSEPHHFETQSNLAACYLKKGLLNDAKIHYAKALELMPRDTLTLFNLGVLETQLGDMDSAIQHYQKAVLLDPDFFAAHNNLGALFIAKEHIAFALHHFQEAARLQPDNASIQYTIQALSQNSRLLSAPTDYVKSLFDSYADHYDQHLLTALDYQIPLHFERILKKQQPAHNALNILDLGCGTGLCSTLIKPFAKTLTGVDLSEKMLDIARDKNSYDTLECNDLNSFLTQKNAAYDLIIAGDVLVYIGELDLFFQQIQQALRPGGIFLFNTEISENENYSMNQSGRFSHQKKYIETLAKKNHLDVIHYEKAVTRMQNNEPVYGHLYLLKNISR